MYIVYFTGNLIVLAEDQDIDCMTKKLIEEYENLLLEVNIFRKTEYMYMSDSKFAYYKMYKSI